MRRALSIALLFGFAWAMPAQAQTYPSRPIKMMIPLASGSAVDVAARIIAEKMGDILGQRFVIENEPGASGLIGTRAGARATPDGYTVLVLNDGVITMLPNMRSDAGYDPFKDFVPVTRLVGIEWVLVANPVVSGEDGCRAHRARQGEARRHQFRLGRLWQPAAHRGGNVHARDQRADDARAVSRPDPGDQRSRRRACLGDVHRAVDGDVIAAGRPPARARLDDAEAAAAARRRRPDHGGIRRARLQLRRPGRR